MTHTHNWSGALDLVAAPYFPIRASELPHAHIIPRGIYKVAENDLFPVCRASGSTHRNKSTSSREISRPWFYLCRRVRPCATARELLDFGESTSGAAPFRDVALVARVLLVGRAAVVASAGGTGV